MELDQGRAGALSGIVRQLVRACRREAEREIDWLVRACRREAEREIDRGVVPWWPRARDGNRIALVTLSVS